MEVQVLSAAFEVLGVRVNRLAVWYVVGSWGKGQETMKSSSDKLKLVVAIVLLGIAGGLIYWFGIRTEPVVVDTTVPEAPSYVDPKDKNAPQPAASRRLAQPPK